MTGEGYRELGEAAWSWVLGQVRDEEGPWLPEVVAGDGPPTGVGDILLDAAQDCGDPARAGVLLRAARTMADAIAERAIRDRAGARWRFTEHRRDRPLLPPNTSWMQSTAGIAAFLLRMAHVVDSGLTDAPVVDRPDQWWTVPAQLRLSQQGSPDRIEAAGP